MVSNSERIKEKTRKFEIVYVGCTNLCKHCTSDHAIDIMKLEIPRPPHSPTEKLSLPLEVVRISSAWRVQPYWGQTSSCKQSRCGRHGLSNILKLQAMFLYLIYHQRAGKTNFFHMRWVDFTLGIRYVPLMTLDKSGVAVMSERGGGRQERHAPHRRKWRRIRGGSRICGKGGRSGYRECRRHVGFWRVPFEDPLWNFKRGGARPLRPPRIR